MEFPCKDCVHFDQQAKIVQGERKPKWFGHCKVKSVYPAEAEEGQLIPLGVKKASPGELAAMVIVRPEEVRRDCADGVLAG